MPDKRIGPERQLRSGQISRENDPVALDVATLFTVLPWLLAGDARDLDALVARAVHDNSEIISSVKRDVIIRGMMQNFAAAQGVKLNPEMVERLRVLIRAAVDERLRNDER